MSHDVTETNDGNRAAEWLALPHTKTWLELVEADEVPEFMYDKWHKGGGDTRQRAACLGAHWAPWPEIDEWCEVSVCPTCHAGPGEPCVIKRRNSYARSRVEQRWHVARTRRNRHNTDVGNAPWPEHRVPGRSYSSINRKALT